LWQTFVNESYPPLDPAFLWQALRRQTRHAIASGCLHAIDTEQQVLEDAGVRFLVRAVSSLRHKAEERHARRPKAAGGRPFNPFLPPEPELTLGAIGDAHLAVLNKFNVLEHHLLIVTRRFEHQETLLTRADLTALWRAMQGIDGLGFYNGGAEAGASQTHKHLQLVPLPLIADEPGLPIEVLLDRAAGEGVPGLPFPHAFRRLPEGRWRDAAEAAALTHELYREMLEQVGIRDVGRDGERRQSAPYNLLLRRGWMLLVPRRREHFESVSVNGLGYAGSLFVRTVGELDLVRRAGPMNVLAAVSGLP
jgi:ATP adenylyltransferase